jgi:hypothetical protein
MLERFERAASFEIALRLAELLQAAGLAFHPTKNRMVHACGVARISMS